MHPHSLSPRISELGSPGKLAQDVALRQLGLQAPAPVIAQALGIHGKTTTKIVSDAGGPNSSYAPDHDSP